MEDHSKRERQRRDRDKRYEERNARQMERELTEQRKELERMRQEIDRKLRDMEVQQHDISLDQELDYEDERESTDSEFEDAEETHESVQTRSSIWSTLVSGAASYLTPSFLKKADATSTPVSILKKKSNAPRMRQLHYAEEKESGHTQPKEIAQGSISFQEEREIGLFPRTVDQGIDAIEGNEVPLADIKVEDRSPEEMQMIERIRALQLQAEQMAQKNEQRQLEESQLSENIKVMDQRKRGLSKEKEKQRKLLLMKQEEEKLEQLLQLQHDEELQQLKRIEMLQQKELLMRKEMEEADRLFALSIEKGARPKVYDELKNRIEKAQGAEVDVHQKHKMEGQIVAEQVNEYNKRKDREIALLQEENSLNRQQELHIEVAGSGRVQSSAKQEGQKSAERYKDRRPFNIPEGNPNVKPFLSSFSGAEPVPNKEVSFENWKQETKFFINSNCYSELTVNQIMRNSLRVQARKVVNTLRPDVPTTEMIEKLEGVFGNVASGESIVQEFYNAYQKPDESTTLWGIRLEEIFERARDKGHVTLEQRDNMLRNKFWRGLYRTDLKNATHVYFVSDKIDFEMLRKKVKAEEYEMSQERAFRQKDKKAEVRMPRNFSKEQTEEQIEIDKVEVHQQKAQQDSSTKILIDLAKDVKGMKSKMDYSNRNQRRPYNNRPYNRPYNRRGRGRGENRNNSGNFQNNETTDNKTPEVKENLNA